MIIVSQDKSTILNFDNAVKVYIVRDAWEEEYYCIGYSTNDRTTIILANYKTEERAKEVLQEIIKRYETCQFLKLCDLGETKIIYAEDNSFVYEMPKE